MKLAWLPLAVGIGAAALGLVTASKLVAAKSRTNVRVLRATSSTIYFRASRYTRILGTFGLTSATGEFLGIIGDSRWDRGGIIARAWQARASRLPAEGESARWTGALHGSPADLTHADSWAERTVDGVTWWEIEPRERRSDLISVHLHGLGASPASVLRTVEVALAAGMRAMVPDLRVPRSNLGLRESVMIGRWIEQQPASAQFVLVGWSMGAEITRHLLLSSMRTRVQSALLISPVVDWPATVGHSGRASRVPRWWMHLVLMSLRGTVVPRLVGMNEAALPLPAARCGDFPPGSVAIHSAGDKVTPLAATVRARDAGAFELHLTAAAPHTMEWNVSPQAALIAQRWFVDQLRSTRP